ncbi:hypothetical protein AYL99_02782 [Fonsecaea erecta]|uniref:DUF202 domain-containing protein n=1 Tax=Fonsecaea erecta TaxID=1367422 RepID=A0A178ZX38_9EURO|nr:hypothetical protein AYL99_02782 [Fonsecaea erecta]OAP63555.1 hypothetical protein AYL99_02782 [Fonsecaea erecta]
MATRRRFRSSSIIYDMDVERYSTSIHHSYPVSPRLRSPSSLVAMSDEAEMARQFWDGLEEGPIETSKPVPSDEKSTIKKFWDEYVAVEMEFGYGVRDHLTNEETFITWFDFGYGMAGFGLVMLQFGILNGRLIDSTNAAHLAKALACTSFLVAILSTVVGAYRFFCQQDALLRGQIFVGGFSMFLSILVFFG